MVEEQSGVKGAEGEGRRGGRVHVETKSTDRRVLFVCVPFLFACLLSLIAILTLRDGYASGPLT